jgi:hypothetical protein
LSTTAFEGEYIETDRDDAVPFFDRLTYTEYLRTEGVGVNLKLGLDLQAQSDTPHRGSIPYPYSAPADGYLTPIRLPTNIQ